MIPLGVHQENGCIRERRKQQVQQKELWRKKMRKWFAVMVVGACICLPAVGQQPQQKDGDSSAVTTAAEAPKTNLFSAPTSVSKSPWALPAQPRTTPFPGPADTKKSSGDDAPGQLWPRYEINGGYSYIDFHPGDPFNTFGNQGATLGFTYNANRVLGLAAEAATYRFDRTVSSGKVEGGLTTFLFGPRLNLRKFDHFVPFAEFL